LSFDIIEKFLIFANLFVKVPQPADSKWTLSAFKLNCHLMPA